ncbi:hypothetical protein AVEN_203751-1 [Araneus ventricosus]|uniref:Uncharacterized protein n=1 Tax=Araneus ventricosus TaxID=182803 RepID=A0A4Y2GF99_ARAVE|nr:hypothetical protein AVEN_203751-1 [Araneus ventricosus]
MEVEFFAKANSESEVGILYCKHLTRWTFVVVHRENGGSQGSDGKYAVGMDGLFTCQHRVTKEKKNCLSICSPDGFLSQGK